MNHRFFEERLFADEPLPPEEQLLLEEHLQSCDRCRALRAAWQETQIELRLAQWVAPRQGFSQRWREHYLHRNAQAQQRRALLVFLINSFLAAVFALPFYLLVAFPSQPLWMRLVIALYNLSALIPLVDGISTFVVTVFRALAEVVTPAMQISLGVAFMGVTIIWLAMLRKFSFGRLGTQ